FFEVWTVREAFSKEEGQGLRILDDVFKVDYDRKKISYKDKILNFDHMTHSVRETRYKISVCSEELTADTDYIFLTNDDWSKIAQNFIK
nr:hypothetical protein [Lachnospiraceae bacterium]